MQRFKLAMDSGGFRLTLRSPALRALTVQLMDFLLSQNWNSLEFQARLGCDGNAFERLRRRFDDEHPLVTLEELHVIHCVFATARLVISPERTFYERFRFYYEDTFDLERDLTQAVARLE